MTFEEVFQQVDPIEGWMGNQDCHALYDYVKNVTGLIVEIGSYMGRSTRLLALSSPRSEIVSIDSYEETVFSNDAPEEIRRRFFLAVQGFGVTLIQGRSESVGKDWKRPIDFLLVDGDHLYPSVSKDIKLFVPHVKMGCFVFFHDYNEKNKLEKYLPNRHGVFKAVQEHKDTYFDLVKHDIRKSGFAICRKK